ncbi:hypothetical protein H0H87_012006 [Tephrocybe sp. NHM501043]|nr:hypothetical protein H0H87_012006 [Tephrocybe sp. NHM501043]
MLIATSMRRRWYADFIFAHSTYEPPTAKGLAREYLKVQKSAGALNLLPSIARSAMVYMIIQEESSLKWFTAQMVLNRRDAKSTNIAMDEKIDADIPTIYFFPQSQPQPRPSSHQHPPQSQSQPQPIVHTPSAIAPQAASASLDLQLAPPSTGPSSVHPVVRQNAAAALAPIRTLYEEVWHQTLGNVQTEMSRMHRELVDALEHERVTRSHLAEEKKVIQLELDRSRSELRSVRREAENLRGQCDQLKADNENLREAAQKEAIHNGDRDEQAQQATRVYIDGQLDQMKVQYAEQLALQRTESERALEEQKAVFERERRELHMIATANEINRSSSESASTLVASDTEKVMTPLYDPDRALGKNHLQQISIHSDRPRTHRMSISSDTRSSVSSLASPRALSFFHPLSPLTPSIPPKGAFSSAPPDYLRHSRRDRSTLSHDAMDVDVKEEPLDLSRPNSPQGQNFNPPSISDPPQPASPPPPGSHFPSLPAPHGSIISATHTTSPTSVDWQLIKREATPVPSRTSSRPTPVPRERSRQSSISSLNTAPPTRSRPTSRPSSRPASPPISPAGGARPTLSLDIPTMIPHTATLETQDPPLPQPHVPSSPPTVELPYASVVHDSSLSHSFGKQAHPNSNPLSWRHPPEPQLPQQLLAPSQPTAQPQPQSSPQPQLHRQPKPTVFKPAHLSQEKLSGQSQPHKPPQNGQRSPHLAPLPLPPNQSHYASHVHEQTLNPHCQFRYQHLAPQPPQPVRPMLQAYPPQGHPQQHYRKRDRGDFEEGVGSGGRANARLKLGNGEALDVMEVKEVKEVRKVNKIGINHMDLLYETRGTTMICRMCRMPGKDEQTTPTETFPADAKWAELVGHCQGMHPKACADLEKLSPSQVGELRQRMMSGKLTSYTLK